MGIRGTPPGRKNNRDDQWPEMDPGLKRTKPWRPGVFPWWSDIMKPCLERLEEHVRPRGSRVQHCPVSVTIGLSQ
ncbi:hypothetical protein RRG08_020025 [Elysia crispata]|uniref:Uncharacterized protein n=1 Tax=Elysia crispata TaxID=231223 RepID=A0AAE1BBE1_9GAST|nr:hypothetical protein RRG08_020025 [Elysia crispata]